MGRQVSIDYVYAALAVAGPNAITAQSISAIVPANAKTATGFVAVGGYGLAPFVASTITGRGAQLGPGNAAFIPNYQPAAPFVDMQIVTAQTLYWYAGTNANSSCNFAVSRYSI